MKWEQCYVAMFEKRRHVPSYARYLAFSNPFNIDFVAVQSKTALILDDI